MTTRPSVKSASCPFAGFLIGAAVAADVSVSWSATFVVRPDYSGDVATIQDAVNAAQSGDQIILGDGVFRDSGNWGVHVFRKALTILSESGTPSRCIIDCGTLNQAFEFDRVEGETLLEGITITRGGNYDIGGALLCWASPITIRNCVFQGNIAEAGGAVHGQESVMTFERCVIANNVATNYAGGGIILHDCTVAIVDCSIVGNGAVPDLRGGGIACARSFVTIERSIISGSTFGAAVWCDETSTVEIECSDVFGNAGGDWVGCLAGQEGMNGNFSADPLYCAADAGVYTLLPESPCADAPGCGLIGALPVRCEEPVVPVTTVLGSPFPNPSRGSVRFRMDVSAGAVGTYGLRVIDVRGRRVVEKLVELRSPNSYEIEWDGMDRSGQAARAGVYFLNLDGPGFRERRKVVRVQ